MASPILRVYLLDDSYERTVFTDSSRTGLEGHDTDTGTAMVVSADGGKTWSPDFSSSPYYVLRMRWEKDGSLQVTPLSVLRLNSIPASSGKSR